MKTTRIHGGSGADRRERFGAARGAGAGTGNHAHRSPAARSERPRTRGRPGARRFRPGVLAPKHTHPGEEIVYVSKACWSISSRASRR